jgi:acyl-coenzyme A synthetase/AMP-(fatty) acid ligase
VLLQDIVELLPARRFRLCGRNADLLEIAGKRASLADLTRRLQALQGVLDAVVFQLDPDPGSQVRRIAALAVAPGRTEKELLGEMRQAIDPLFLPRPLRLVEALPRNETGKLPRSALLSALRKNQ